MLAKRFFYVCAGLLCLALAYHLGARNAGAQSIGSPVVGLGPATAGYGLTAANTSGDVFGTNDGIAWVYLGNVYGGPTPAQRETWGATKARYRVTR